MGLVIQSNADMHMVKKPRPLQSLALLPGCAKVPSMKTARQLIWIMVGYGDPGRIPT
jgi:hypothetical protein